MSQGVLTMPTPLLFSTEMLSDSEEDQVSSNTNSYDYGEAPRLWAHGDKDTRSRWGWVQGPSAGLAGQRNRPP